MTQPRLYIATRDPRGLGGVTSMARFVYKTAIEAGYDPCLVCNVLNPSVDVRISDLLTLDVRREIEHTTVDGMEIKGVPRYFPEVEFLQHVLNRRLWWQAMADGELYFGVGGSNHCCLPLALEGVSFGSWTATLFWEDRVDRLWSTSIPRRIRDRLSRPVMEWIEGRVYRRTDSILVLSEYTADAIAERHGVNRDHIEVVPYPVDTDLFNPDGPTKPDDDCPTVLFVGRFNDTRKNTPLLLEAVSSLKDEITEIRLLLIGDEPDNELQRRIGALGLESHVNCIDYVDNEELPDYYRGADVFAIPSHQEGLAIVGLEAMACGTPVVSTRCGGPEEYVTDGETGYLVNPDDPDAMAEKLATVLVDSDQSQELRDRCASHIQSEYRASDIREMFKQRLERL